MKASSIHLFTEVRARNGLPSLQVTGEDGQTKALHSLYDPEKEACSLVGGYSYGGEKHIVVLGLGLGYHVLELARRFPDAELLIVEPSSEIYGMARACGTIESLSDRATFIVGRSPSEALREITRRQLEAGLNPISIFRFPASFSLFSEFFTPEERKKFPVGDYLHLRAHDPPCTLIDVVTRETKFARGNRLGQPVVFAQKKCVHHGQA